MCDCEQCSYDRNYFKRLREADNSLPIPSSEKTGQQLKKPIKNMKGA